MVPEELPDVCTDPDSLTCALVHDWTGNDRLAQASGWLIGKPLAVLAIIALALLARWLLHRFIDRLVRRAGDPVTGARRRAQRAQTLGSLLRSIVTVVVGVVAVFMALSEVGLDIAPLIASAGVVGIALGFGAQSLVKDYLSGIFMTFEDQYGVGDVIRIGDVSGTVEAVSLRVTRLRDIEGTVWYIRNGEVFTVGNQSQTWARSVLDIGVGYAEDISRVRRILKEVAHDLQADPAFSAVVLEEPEVWGVQGLDADSVTIRIALKTVPLEQWRVSREMRERIKTRFDAEGIEIPFPQRVVWHRDAGAGPQPSGE